MRRPCAGSSHRSSAPQGLKGICMDMCTVILVCSESRDLWELARVVSTCEKRPAAEFLRVRNRVTRGAATSKSDTYTGPAAFGGREKPLAAADGSRASRRGAPKKILAFHVKSSVICTWLRHRRHTAATRHHRPVGLRLHVTPRPKWFFRSPALRCGSTSGQRHFVIPAAQPARAGSWYLRRGRAVTRGVALSGGMPGRSPFGVCLPDWHHTIPTPRICESAPALEFPAYNCL